MRALGWLLAACVAAAAPMAAAAPAAPGELAALYQARVDRRLAVPAAEVAAYGQLADAAFAAAGVAPPAGRYLVVVDRAALVQAVLVLWRSATGDYQLVGASPVSTGRPGSFDHFETPLGVFAHSPANPDFRAEGTYNANGIRGYGVKGMRVFDFGWVAVPKGWGDRRVIDMRLQMHATEPDSLEWRLGTRQSKGCIRIPGTLNRLLDRFGVLDADYETLPAQDGRRFVLAADREPVPGAGRWLVVVDSARTGRPAWSPLPRAGKR